MGKPLRDLQAWSPARDHGHLARPRLPAVAVSPILRVSPCFRFRRRGRKVLSTKQRSAD